MSKIKKIKKINPSNNSRNIDYKNIEEVYKLNFTTQNISDINNYPNKEQTEKLEKLKKVPDFLKLHTSIERVKKFFPNLSEKINITGSKNLEKKLVKRFENQETEKIMKEDLRQINEKRNEIKKSISDNLLTFQKLDNDISDMKLSLYVHSKMLETPIKLTHNKKLRNKNDLFGLRTFSENNIYQRKGDEINKINKEKENKNDFERRLKLLNEKLKKKKEEISEINKILPQMEIDREAILLKLKHLEQEKKDLNIIKNKITEKLYFHYINILKEGIDTRNQGFSYIVQEILNLGKKILLSHFPDYLDIDSIKYLLEQAKLKFKLEEKNLQLKKLKNYFSDSNLFRKNRKSQVEENKFIDEKLIFNKTEGNNQFKCVNYKRIPKFDRNKYNNTFWNMNDFSGFISTERTDNSNYNIEKKLNNTEVNLNKNDKYNKTSSDLKFCPKPNEKKSIKKKVRNSFYTKLLYNHRLINNSLSPIKKINLSDFNSIPEKLYISQVEEYLNKQKKRITKENNKQIADYFKLDGKIKKIKNELEENKKKEMKRIFKKYLQKEYSQKFISEKEKVLSALIGEDNVQPEIKKQIRKTKLYFESIKKMGLINNHENREYKVNQISHNFIKKMGN